MTLEGVVGITLMYVVGVGPWLRWIYVSSRRTWLRPVKVAKLVAGKMTSDSDVIGLY